MAWSFSDEIHALAGYDADSTSTTVSGETFVVHTNQWLTEGAREVINNLPVNLQKLCTDMVSFTSAAVGSEAETLNTGKVFNVFAGSVNCRLIPNNDKYRASDSGDVLYATSTDPAYYIESNYINVLPASLSCKYEEVQYPTVANTDTGILVFPDEAEHLVVLYASMKALQYRMQIKSSDLPSDSDLNAVPPDTPSLATVAFSESNSLSITATEPTAISLTTVNYSDVSHSVSTVLSSLTAPLYTKPHATQGSFNDFFESGSLNPFDDSDPGETVVTAVPPEVPTIATIAYDSAVVGEVTDSSALVSEQSTVDVSSNAPIYTKPTPIFDIGQFETFLETNEDTELAQIQMARLQLELGEFQADIQNELNEFNKENVRYQIEFQEAVTRENQNLQVSIANANNLAQEYRQEAQQSTQVSLQNQAKAMEDDIADNNSKIQKFSVEIQVYQAEVGAQVQDYSQKLSRYQLEVSNVYQAWAKTESDNLQIFQLDIQNELNEFNKENVSFQYEVQKALADANTLNQIAMQNGIQEARDAIENNNAEVQRFQSMASHYATQVNEDVQKYTTQLQSDIQTMQGTIANNQALLSKYQAESAEYTAEINAQVQEFTTKIQKHTADYQWLQGQYASLKADYTAGIVVLKGEAGGSV